jgi:Ca2+-binding RTX toxin-like protein
MSKTREGNQIMAETSTVFGLVLGQVDPSEADDILFGTINADIIGALGGDDWVFGLAGDDVLVGGDGADALYGGNGSDTLNGADNDDTLVGGQGNDNIDGRSGNDIVSGNDGQDTLRGGGGDDQLDGGGEADQILGQTGDDVLRGGSGADTLDGGSGNDTLNGGSGADVFRLGASSPNYDTIVDFQKGEDRINLLFFEASQGFPLQFDNLDTNANGVLDDGDENVATDPTGDTEINLTPFLPFDSSPELTSTLTVLGLSSFGLLSATDFDFV